jgi:hypothetical protein
VAAYLLDSPSLQSISTLDFLGYGQPFLFTLSVHQEREKGEASALVFSKLAANSKPSCGQGRDLLATNDSPNEGAPEVG